MKKLNCFKIFTVLILSIIAINILYPQQMNMKDRYYLGAFNGLNKLYYLNDPNDPYWNLYNYNLNNPNGLFFNTNHCYENLRPPENDPIVGGFYDNVNVYENNVSTIFDNSYNNGQNLILWRIKALQPAYGQRNSCYKEIDYYCNIN